MATRVGTRGLHSDRRDTPAAIAKRLGRTVEQMACFNNLAILNSVSIGQVLRIPPLSYVCAPTATPGPQVAEAFCGTIADLESALQSFEAIKVKAGNASKLKDAADGVSAALTPITDTAAADLGNLVDGLVTAVGGLNFGRKLRYRSDIGQAGGRADARDSVAALHAAISDLRQAATCSTLALPA